jgi:roadblock/LC7 domain-containing protein
LAGKTISDVELGVYQSGFSNNGTVEVYRLTRAYVAASHAGACEEANDTAAVSWTEYSGTNTWTNAGGDFAAELLGSFVWDEIGWRTVTNEADCGGGTDDCLVDYVQKVANGTYTDYGLILKTSSESVTSTRNGIGSDIATDGTRPYLKVTFS